MAKERQKVWDLPTRIFHWLLVVLLAFAWWSAEVRDMEWHLRAGMAVVVLIVFRILWGLFGTSTARFAQFVKGPAAVWSYVRPSTPSHDTIGHNPLGGWSVIFMLLLVAVVVVTGLFAVDIDGIDSGPLSYMVSFDQGRTASAVHDFSFHLLQLVVVVHVLAIIFYLVVKRRNLMGPMITGSQKVREGGPVEMAVFVSPWRLLVAVVLALLVAYGVWDGFRF
jgi:cytochrome b